MASQSAPASVVCCVCGSTSWSPLFFKQGFNFVRCRRCGAARLDPLPTMRQLEAHYSLRTEAGNYDVEMARYRRQSIAETLNFIRRFVGDNESINILDVGTYDGELLVEAKSRFGWEGWGVELNRSAVESADHSLEGRIYCGFLESYDPPDSINFKIVAAIALIEHLIDPLLLIRRGAELLDPGGLLIVQTPNSSSIARILLGRYWPCWAAPEHTWYFGPGHIAAMGRKCGLEVVHSQSHWKHLEIGYVYHQLQFFGPEIRRLLTPIFNLLPAAVQRRSLPFYGGEMYVVLKKK